MSWCFIRLFMDVCVIFYLFKVMEVLQLKCGVSVNKMVRNQGSATDLDWIEVGGTLSYSTNQCTVVQQLSNLLFYFHFTPFFSDIDFKNSS